MKFQESALAHSLLDGKEGIEIGASAHNPFGLNTKNVGRDTKGTVYEQEEIKLCGEAAKLEIVCEGDNLTLPDCSVDFVISSHVLEHFRDPIKAIKEWLRVVKPGGLVFVIFPHKERTFDKDKPRTTLADLLARHEETLAGKGTGAPVPDEHHTIWYLADALELCSRMGWTVLTTQDPDDKVGNGFTFVIQKAA